MCDISTSICTIDINVNSKLNGSTYKVYQVTKVLFDKMQYFTKLYYNDHVGVMANMTTQAKKYTALAAELLCMEQTVRKCIWSVLDINPKELVPLLKTIINLEILIQCHDDKGKNSLWMSPQRYFDIKHDEISLSIRHNLMYTDKTFLLASLRSKNEHDRELLRRIDRLYYYFHETLSLKCIKNDTGEWSDKRSLEAFAMGIGMLAEIPTSVFSVVHARAWYLSVCDSYSRYYLMLLK